MSQAALNLGSVQTLRFEPVEHRYFLEPSGEELPGVTRALEECGLTDFSMVPRDILLAAQERGTAVHSAIHFLEDGELDLASVAAALGGYLEAYDRFKHDMGYTPLVIEKFVHSLDYRWAGRVDSLGSLERKDAGRDSAVVDYKTGDILPAHEVQVSLYTSALPDPRKYRRLTVKLDADGRYHVREYEPQAYSGALNTGHACVAVWHWKRTWKQKRTR